MKAQRKEADTAKTHVTIRLKKGGSRFECLIKRDSYVALGDREKGTKASDFFASLPVSDIVQEVFANSAKLEPADKYVLEKVFEGKDKTAIIMEILERGELIVSDVDRSEHTVAASEYFTKVATLVSHRALGVPPKEEEDASAVAAAAASAASSGAAAKKKKAKSKGDDDDAAAASGGAAAAAAGGAVRLQHYTADVIERELKNVKWKPIVSKTHVDIEDDVNAAFLALAKKSDALEGLMRDARLWTIDAKAAADAQTLLSNIAAACGKRPYKVLTQSKPDKSGGQQLAVLVDFEVTPASVSGAVSREGLSFAVAPKTHVPKTEDENLAFFVPAAPVATTKVTSQPAAAGAAAAAAAASNSVAGPEEEDSAKGAKKAGGKKAKAAETAAAAAAAVPAPAAKKAAGPAKKGNSLEDELAALGKGGSDSDSDDAPKMQAKKKKK